jgi:fructokinase
MLRPDFDGMLGPRLNHTNRGPDMSSIAVIGEAVVDAFVHSGDAAPGELDLRLVAGGGPANTAVALSRLGSSTQFLGRLSRGVLGDLLRNHLLHSGVDLSASVIATQEATFALAAVDSVGVASYSFYRNGTADWQWTAEELASWQPDDAVAVHTGSLALALDPGGPLIERLLRDVRPRTTVSIDPNVRPGIVTVEGYRERLARWTRLADVLRLSADDLNHLHPGISLEQACDAFHGQGVRLVVVTRGALGAVASLNGDRVTVPAMDIVPVDTVGAGDAFTAGLLHSLRLQGHLGGRLETLTTGDVERAMAFAAMVSGRTCQVVGANPPWAHELTDDGGDVPRAAAPTGADSPAPGG